MKKLTSKPKRPANKKASGGRSAPTCSLSSTPETDGAYKVAFRQGNLAPLKRRCAKMERERNELIMRMAAIHAREHLTCGWCGEMMDAPPGFKPPITTEKLKKAVRIHILDCPKHPIRETEKEVKGLLIAGREIIEAARRSLPRPHPTIERNAKLFIPENAPMEARPDGASTQQGSW